jgi:hypothetical protein
MARGAAGPVSSAELRSKKGPPRMTNSDLAAVIIALAVIVL